MDGYWTKLMERRASRRAVVVGGATLAGSAALLAACGGGDDNKSGNGGQSSSADKVFRDTKEEGPIVKGGTWRATLDGDLSSLDPYRQSAANVSTTIGSYMHNRLMAWKQGPGVDPFGFEVAPDMATGYEVSDGGLTYTFKIRQGVKFHDIAPVSAHALEAEDVTASYKRFSTGVAGVGNVAAGGVGAPQFGNSFLGVVDSVSSPDKNTVVFKLTKPNAAFVNIIATQLFLWIFPREAGISYDPLKQVIGTGPWMFSNYVPSSRYEFKKNPAYYETGLPNIDNVTFFVIQEAAQRLSQFSAGSIHTFTPTQFGDFQSLTQDPAVRIYSTGFGGPQGTGFCRDNPDSPFLKDVRVRQAFSLLLDRQELLETFNDIDKYNAYGVKREYRMANFIGPNLNNWWVDPRGKEMGDAAQWYQHDPAKAKQLISAAGYPNGFDTVQHFSSNNANDLYLNLQPILNQWLVAAGIRAKLSGEDYASVFNPHSWHGEGDGFATWTWQTFGDPGQQLNYLFGPDSTRNQMGTNDAKFNTMYDQQQAELDATKRKSQLIDIFKYMQTENRHVGWGYGTVDSYTLYRPEVRNLGAYRHAENTGWRLKNWWLAA